VNTNSRATTPTQGVPGDVIDLTRWYLTLPIKDPTGKDTSGPWDVYQPDLRHFSCEYFRVASVASVPVVEYIAPVNGTTTSGSGSTRSELREMAGGTTKASWAFDDGKRHVLTTTLTCDGTGITNGRREVIVGQIHGPGGTPPIIVCVNDKRGGVLELFKQGPRQGDLLTGLKPDTTFTYRIESPGNGRLKVYACLGDVDGLPTTPQFDFPSSAFTETSGLYFKAGVYNKTEVDAGASGAAVVRQFRCDLV
jgi:Alginate lyase